MSGILTKLSELMAEFAKNSAEEYTLVLSLNPPQFDLLLKDVNDLRLPGDAVTVKEIEFNGPGGKIVIKRIPPIVASELSPAEKRELEALESIKLTREVNRRIEEMGMAPPLHIFSDEEED